ncbi:MAG: PAS-domain containing protein, partial [Pseudomonadota bacterium]
MYESLIDPDDPLERRNEKLGRIVDALMRRVEQGEGRPGAAYRLFERAALLEDQVRERTSDLERTVDLLNETNAQLEAANREREAARTDLAAAIEAIDEGFALFGADDTLVLFNSRFSVHMPDVRATLRPGLAFADYVDVIAGSAHLDRADAGPPDAWARQRIERHRESHVMFNVRLVDDRWVQVSEHRTPNGGTAILQTEVTDLIRAERAERGRIVDGQERLMRATLDHIRQGVCIFDAYARIVGWNRRMTEMFFLGQERIPARATFMRVMEILDPALTLPSDHDAAALVKWAARPAGRPPLNFEIAFGEARILAVHAQETPDRGFLISFTDVTAERAAARVLTQTNETLEKRVVERTLELEDAVEAA